MSHPPSPILKASHHQSWFLKRFFGLLILTITLGLLSRSPLIELPSFIATYAGDTLWGMMVFWIFCCLRPKHKVAPIALAALVFSFSIEFSQFYHAPWIDGIRAIKLGGLVLGFGFKLSDLVCYSVGILIGACIDAFLITKRFQQLKIHWLPC